MDVRIVLFPETKVAAIEHRGAPELEHESSKKLIAWRIENGASPDRHRTYGVHYFDPSSTALSAPRDHRVDFCISYAGPVVPNVHGVIGKVISASRCAVARHVGSREHNTAATYLHLEWLPRSGETPSGLPLIFHYLNVGANVQAHDMITDVYLPLR